MLGTAAKGYNFGLAGLAMIARMFADLSDWIARGVVANGWLTDNQLIHYNLHADLDMRHAEELFVGATRGLAQGAGLALLHRARPVGRRLELQCYVARALGGA